MANKNIFKEWGGGGGGCGGAAFSFKKDKWEWQGNALQLRPIQAVIFFANLGRGPRAFQIGKSSMVNP